MGEKLLNYLVMKGYLTRDIADQLHSEYLEKGRSIRELVAEQGGVSEEQLLEALQDAGFYSTQATISRDIKELRIVKELTKFGTYRYTSSAREVSGSFSARLNAIFKECVTGYDFAQNLVVIRTIPGLAGAAASAVDSMEMSFILGTIGGDDTVIIVMRDMDAAAAFCGELKELLG